MRDSLYSRCLIYSREVVLCMHVAIYSFDKLTEDKHIVKTKIYSLSIYSCIGYIINFCPIDRESEVPTDINV